MSFANQALRVEHLAREGAGPRAAGLRGAAPHRRRDRRAEAGGARRRDRRAHRRAAALPRLLGAGHVSDGWRPEEIVAPDRRRRVEMLDQTRLPGEEARARLRDLAGGGRGHPRASRSAAPRRSGSPGRWAWPSRPRAPTPGDLDAMRAEIAAAAAALRSARPTAVNLAWAVDAQERLAARAPRARPGAGRGAGRAAARALHDDEVARCEAIGAHGAAAAGAGRARHDHCNAGALATGRLRHGARGGARRRTPPTRRCAWSCPRRGRCSRARG